ncbi:MAG: DUF2812 domain-containing protein [bacterium]|nr:DUF2812 domain-containing protein [bacterium]
MADKKTVFKFFTVPQYRKEEEYLSEMHEKGWRLTGITFPGFYHFEECTPAHGTYRLDYNPDSTKNHEEYVQLFDDCGWKYLFDFVGYSYFFKEGDSYADNEEIFCDDESRLEMMKRVFKGRVLPLIIIFGCTFVPQFLMNSIGYGGGSIAQQVLASTMLGLAAVYLLLFASFSIQFYQYEKMIHPDEKGVLKKYVGIFGLIVAMAVFLFGVYIYNNQSDYQAFTTDNEYIVDAERLNCTVKKDFDLKEGAVIKVNHESEHGELYISVAEDDTEPIFYGNTYGMFESFSLTIPHDGRYTITCSGKNMGGTVTFEFVQ